MAEEVLANGAQMIDLRTPEQFANGHIEGDLPLLQVSKQLTSMCITGAHSVQLSDLASWSKQSLQEPHPQIVVCCATGAS